MSFVKSVLDYIEIINKITTNESEIAEKELERLSSEQKNNILPEYMMQYYKVITNNREKRLQEIQTKSNDKANDNMSDNKRKTSHYKFYYRGHYNVRYQLIPSAFREDNWDKEDYYYHEIMVRCPEHFQYSSHLNKLVMMQHYECPTRLLDVTTNPLVALFFACKNYRCEKCDSTDEGHVFIFPTLPDDVAYSDSDTALMLACLARFSTNDKQLLYNIANRDLINGRFKQATGGSRRYDDYIVERFYHEITTELASFKREIKPIDLLQPLFIQPNKSNGRILKQDGAFILNGLSKDSREALSKINSISYETIIINNKSTILRELELLGIHEAALFPEVDKVANYLKEQKM